MHNKWDGGNMSYTELVSYVNSGKVESITLDGSGQKAEVKLNEDEKIKTVVIPSEESFTDLLTQNELKGNHIIFLKEEASAGVSTISSIISLVFNIVINLLFIALIVMMFKSMKRTIGNTDGGNVDIHGDHVNIDGDINARTLTLSANNTFFYNTNVELPSFKKLLT